MDKGKVIHEVLENLRTLSCKDVPMIIALDGRCASGKTDLAEKLQKMINCTVFHMDDFFLRPKQRSKERLNTPGGNVDYERFREEILMPLKSGMQKISYQPYDCHEQQLLQPVVVEPTQTVLVEGSYSCHPELWDFYSLHIFLTVNPDEQLRRIARRNGKDNIRQFQEQWIPLEEQYFMAYQVIERCDICFET
ncbi:MAG: AAA family ATPase [Lachnospiraceae bacterium]|nr:AAA family ATPase [Lachnospiraceae bacterium]